MAIYNDELEGFAAAERRDSLRTATSFAMIIFDESVYLPEAEFVLLVIFAYYPMCLGIYPIFLSIAISIFKFMEREKVKNEEMKKRNES